MIEPYYCPAGHSHASTDEVDACVLSKEMNLMHPADEAWIDWKVKTLGIPRAKLEAMLAEYGEILRKHMVTPPAEYRPRTDEEIVDDAMKRRLGFMERKPMLTEENVRRIVAEQIAPLKQRLDELDELVEARTG